MITAAMVAVGASAAVRTQSPRPMSIVDLLNVPRLSDPQLSPAGKDVLYARADADWKSGRRVSHLWRASVDGGGGDTPPRSSGSVGPGDPDNADLLSLPASRAAPTPENRNTTLDNRAPATSTWWPSGRC